MTFVSKKQLAIAALAALGAGSAPAFAQAWPAKPVTVIIPYAPGGPTDVVARAIAPGLEAGWKQPFLVENRPGAGGMIGTAEVSRAAPDGYKILFQSNGVLLAPYFQKTIPYDPADLRPIVGVASSFYLLSSNTGTPAKNLREFITYVKGRPKQDAYGTILYTPLDLDTNAILQKAGLDMRPITYNGGAALAEATARGDVQFILATPSSALTLVKAGKMTGLAYTAAQRSPLLPDVPTMREQGLDMTAGYTLGLWVQSKTPEPIASRITNDVANVSASPAVVEKLRELAYEVPAHRQYGQQMQTEQKSFMEVIQRIGLKPQ